jgi:hypothetical protein
LDLLVSRQNEELAKIESIELAMEIEPNRDRQYRAVKLLDEAAKLARQSQRLASDARKDLNVGNRTSAQEKIQEANEALVWAAINKDRARATLQREVLA